LAAFVVIFDDDPSGLIYGQTRVFRFLFPSTTRALQPVLHLPLACRIFDVCIGDFVGKKK
jgi:hypothetical protein